MPVIGSYVSGQILYAANLNASFLQAAAIGGDLFTGNVTIPNLSITGKTFENIVAVNTALAIQNVDVGSGLKNAYNTANAAFAAANTANVTQNATLIQTVYNTANAASVTANNALAKTGGSVSGTITINSTLNVSNTITGNTEIQGNANSVIFPGQFRAIEGNFGALLRNDGVNFYLLTTGNVSVATATTANFNTLRPFQFSLTTGAVAIDGTGVGTNFGGSINTPILNATTANVSQIRFKTLSNSGNYILQPQDSGLSLLYNNTNPIVISTANNLFTGFRVVVSQINTGTVSFSPGPGTIINPARGTLLQITNQFASASLAEYTANTFLLDGSIQ